MKTLTDRRRPVGTAPVADSWSAWQPPVDIYDLADTVASYDDALYGYNNHDGGGGGVKDDILNGERLQTKTGRQNASETEGRSISLYRIA